MYLLGEYCIHIDIQGCIKDIRILSGWDIAVEKFISSCAVDLHFWPVLIQAF